MSINRHVAVRFVPLKLLEGAPLGQREPPTVQTEDFRSMVMIFLIEISLCRLCDV